MPNQVKRIPDDYKAATPYLSIKGAAAAIEFYKKAFGAVEVGRFAQPDGKIGHAEIRINNAPIMLADEYPDIGFLSPKTLGGTPVTIHLYVEDVDALVDRAVSAGAELQRPVKDQFYGDRSGCVADPFGHLWNFASRIEEVSVEEMQHRFDEMMQQK